MTEPDCRRCGEAIRRRARVDVPDGVGLTLREDGTTSAHLRVVVVLRNEPCGCEWRHTAKVFDA